MIRKSAVFDILLILYFSFFSAQANKSCSDNEQFIENLILTEESICHESKKYNEQEFIPVKDRRLNFYVSANSGKIYSDNSETFVNGIKAIGERILSLIKEDSYIKVVIKSMATKAIEKVLDFNGAIDFQWFSSISLGCYAGENVRVDFEAMYSWVNIENGNSPPVFYRLASIFAFLLNFYYNPSIQDTQIAPYIGLSIGPTVFRLRRISSGSPQNSIPLNIPWFAYQVKLGVDYSIMPEVKSFFGYRYFCIPIPIADDISTHSIEVGLTFNF